jgi:hypothetical protein
MFIPLPYLIPLAVFAIIGAGAVLLYWIFSRVDDSDPRRHYP